MSQGYRTYYTVEASKMEPVFDEFMTHLYAEDPSEGGGGRGAGEGGDWWWLTALGCSGV